MLKSLIVRQSKTPEESKPPPHRTVTFKFDITELDPEEKIKKKLSISQHDDIWLVRSLKETFSQRQYESKALTRLDDFVRKITENWQNKLQVVRNEFEDTIAKIAEERKTEIYYNTCCLKEELQDVKDTLDQTEDLDSEIIDNLKETWFSVLYKWKIDMFEMEKKTSKLLKTEVASYLGKLVVTRHDPCHTLDVMLTLVLELNQIIIGNVQAITETVHHLELLWNTHFKDWCVSYYLRVGLNIALLKEEEEESLIEEQELEIEDTAALGTVLEAIVSHSKEGAVHQMEFRRISDLDTIPHLAYFENYWESFNEKERIVLEVLESEAKKMISIKKFIHSLNPEERALFGDWARNAGYGEDAEQKFMRASELALFYIKEIKTLMMQTMELWNDLTDRLEALKYVTEKLRCKQKIQIASLFQEWEINMNFAVDELRQAHSLVALENMWNVHIDKLFFEYKTMLTQSLQYEKFTLDTYITMSKKTFELFLTALDLLITDSWTTYTENVPEASISSHLSRALEDYNYKLAEIIMTCINNARIGYVESLEFFRDEIQDNIDKLDTAWPLKKKAELNWQYALKEEMMKHRMHRMKTDVLDIRAAELRKHEETLYRHTEGIRERLKYLSSIDISEAMQPLIEDFHAVAEEVAKINTNVSPGSFPRVIASLDKAKQKFDYLCLRCDHDMQRSFEHIDRYFEWMEQISIQLLRDIKLFSEGGNFSADEVTGVLFVIQRLDKEISNEMDKIDKNFTNGVSFHDMELKNKIEKFINYMKRTHAEFLLRSNMRLIVNRAKRAIKVEVMNGRALLKMAESILSPDIKDPTELSELLEAVKKAYSFIAVPEDFVDLTGNIGSRPSSLPNERRSKSSVFSSRSIIRKRGRSVYPLKPSRSLVFKFIEEQDKVPNNFLQRVTFIISKCKTKLLRPKINLRSRSESSLTMRALMKSKSYKTIFNNEIEPEINELHRQSFVTWLDMVNESLKLFVCFGNKVSSVLNDEYKKFEDIWILSMELIEKQLFEELEEFDKASIKNKEEMKRRLKTMFGHPKHKERLTAMTNEAVAFCKSQTENLKTIVIFRRNQIKQLLLLFFEEKKPFLKELYDKIESLYENEELEHVFFRLAHHLLSRSRAKKILNNLTSSRDQKNHFSSSESKSGEEILRDSADFGTSGKLTRDVTTLIKSVANRLKAIISFRDEMVILDEQDLEDDFVQEEPLEYVLLCKDLKTSLLKTAMKMCQLGKLSLAVYIDEMQTWLKNWRTDCARLNELYTYNPGSKDRQSPRSPHRRNRVPGTRVSPSLKTRSGAGISSTPSPKLPRHKTQ